MEWKVRELLPFIPRATDADSAIFDGEILVRNMKLFVCVDAHG
jgi:hypothetical protein